MNVRFAFQASIIKRYCDQLSWQLMREGGEIDRLDGCILDNNYVEATAADGLRAVASDLRRLANEIEHRAGQVLTEVLQAAE